LLDIIVVKKLAKQHMWCPRRICWSDPANVKKQLRQLDFHPFLWRNARQHKVRQLPGKRGSTILVKQIHYKARTYLVIGNSDI
jgi:hypothetical protein